MRGFPLRAPHASGASRTGRPGINPCSARGLWALAGALVTLASATGQVAPVYTDDSPQAQGALARAAELAASKNVGESARVLQTLLEEEGERVVPVTGDPGLFVPLRGRVHELLRSDAALLARYRENEEARGEELLARGAHAEVERTRLLTRAGVKAAGLVARDHLLAGRFEGARLTLESIEDHPDAGDPALAGPAADAADLLRRYLPRPEVEELARRWAARAGRSLGPASPIEPPAGALARTVGAIAERAGEASPEFDMSPEVLAGPALQSVWISERARADLGDIRMNASDRGEAAWAFPSVVGETIVVNDGSGVSAFDRVTLERLWSSSASSPVVEERSAEEPEDEPFFRRGVAGGLEDATLVSAKGGVVVAPSGLASYARSTETDRVRALALRDGRELWNTTLPPLGNATETAGVRGPIVIDGDTAVAAVRKNGQFRRSSGLYIVGLSLRDGSARWTRLVGSSGGTLRGASRVSDAPLLWRGVLYRSDEIGLIAAVETASGRPRWVRATRPYEGQGFEGGGPWTSSGPVWEGGRLFVLSPDRSELMCLDPETGRVVGARALTALGDVRYLVGVGRFLAIVGVDRVHMIPFEGWADAPARSAELLDPAIVGRAVAAGRRLLVPLDQQLAIIDPEAPAHDQGAFLSRAGMPARGNILALGDQLVVADGGRLHGFLAWEKAESTLRSRLEASPEDAGPALSLAELAARSGRHALVGPALETALGRVSIDPLSDASRASRARLFELASRLTREAIGTLGADGPGAAGAAATLSIATRAADSDLEHASALMLAGALGEATGRPGEAIVAYQSILASEGLSAAMIETDQLATPAGAEASRRVVSVVKSAGAEVYAPFDAEAAAGLAIAGDDPAALLALASRYPGAGQNAEILARASDRLATMRDASGSAAALARALDAAELAAGAGRPEAAARVGALGARLIALFAAQGRPASASQTAARLTRLYPGVALRDPERGIAADDLLPTIRAELARRDRLPRLGDSIGPDVQTLAGWAIMEPLSRELGGASPEQILLLSPERREFALWSSAASGELRPAWSRTIDAIEPALVRLTSERVLLYWATPEGGFLEMADAADGTTLWRTEPTDRLFGVPTDPELSPVGAPEPGMIATPLDGQVRLRDILVSVDEQTVLLCERSGRAAVFELSTGRELWKRNDLMGRVYDADLADGHAAFAGGNDRIRPDGRSGEILPAVLVVDARTGAPVAEPAGLIGHIRWLRLIPGSQLLVGMRDRVFNYDLAAGRQRWSITDSAAQASHDAWVIGDRLYLLAGQRERELWNVHAGTGESSPDPLVTGMRLGRGARVSAYAYPDRAVFTGDGGVVVVGPEGKTVGLDPLGGLSALLPAAAAEGVLVSVDAEPQPGSDGPLVRLMMFDPKDGRLLRSRPLLCAATPTSLALIDGRILFTAGGTTFAVAAPAR